MLVQQYIHQLNNSELGRTGVHETYVSVPRGIAPQLDFLSLGKKTVIFKRNGKAYNIEYKNVANGEFRFTGLGQLYRDSNVYAGDLFVLEEAAGELWIDFVYRTNLLVFSSLKDCLFECRNEDRLDLIKNKKMKCYNCGVLTELTIESKGDIQPRTDSQRRVNVYEIQISGEAISGGRNQVLNLFIMNEGNFLVQSVPDTIRKLEWSNHE